jgi:hypothetical protein
MFQLVPDKDLKILHFDIENRPLAYLGADYTTGEVTAIAWGWADDEQVYAELMTTNIEASTKKMLKAFRKVYDEADIVTGHYIRKHDLPVLNGAMVEYGFDPLGDKLVSDTKTDLVRMKYLSAAQESLAGMYALPEHKHHMSQPEWRKANRLTKEGLEATAKRVVWDVIQHRALRAKLLEMNALKKPKMWSA